MVAVALKTLNKILEMLFWLDVVQAIKLLWEILSQANHTGRLATPLWLNKEIFVHNSKGF